MAELYGILGLGDANLRFVLLGSLLIGATGGLLGTFAVLRRRSLMGDALAHAALPGVALAFMLTGSKALPVLMAGATVSGIIGVMAIQFIVNNTRVKADAAIGIVLSVLFGLGIVLLTHVQRMGGGNQSGLDKFLFGQAAAMVGDDLQVMTWMAVAIIAAVVLLYKEFKALIFDPGFLTSLGYSARTVDLALMGLIVLTVMVGLQAVGVVLMAAMLITPAVAARFWTDRLHVLVVLATVIGGLAGVAGTLISSAAPRIPTGPVMVLAATLAFLVSAVMAPRRGALARWRRERGNAARETRHHLLRALVELGEGESGRRAFSGPAIAGQLGWSEAEVRRLARRMSRAGLLAPSAEGWELTAAGREQGEFVVKSHRLWEHYLVHRDILTADHVDRPADEVEHLLTPEIIGRLEEILRRDEALASDAVENIHGTGSGYRRLGREGGQ